MTGPPAEATDDALTARGSAREFNWKPLKSYASTCKTVTVDTQDGSQPLTAKFHFIR